MMINNQVKINYQMEKQMKNNIFKISKNKFKRI